MGHEENFEIGRKSEYYVVMVTMIEKWLKKIASGQLCLMLLRGGISYKSKMSIGYYNMKVSDDCDKEQFH